TYCSEMVSCNEAKFYLSNCPNVKIDGDNDGDPHQQFWTPS
ncbi:excalibur calcium-binding domain-containing protein, partial [Vibrio parahaemolyticus]